MRRDAGRVATRAGAHPAGHCALAIGIGMPGSAWAGARAHHFPAAGIPHRRPRSFWCRSSFLVPGFEGPWHHSRKSSQLYSSRCMHTQTPPAYVLVQGRSRGSAGVGPGAAGSVCGLSIAMHMPPWPGLCGGMAGPAPHAARPAGASLRPSGPGAGMLLPWAGGGPGAIHFITRSNLDVILQNPRHAIVEGILECNQMPNPMG